MTISRSRRAACALALLVGVLQSLLSAPALLGAVALLTPHGHEMSVLADADHVDLVLSHAASERSDARHGTERHFHSATASESDHVVHLTSGDVVRDSMRRVHVDAPAPGFGLPAPRSSTRFQSVSSAREALPRASALRTVVLRI